MASQEDVCSPTQQMESQPLQPPEPETSIQQRPIALLLSQNPQKFPNVEYFSYTPQLRFGRNKCCEYKFDDSLNYISAIHCRIYRDPDPALKEQEPKFILQDLSSNGTYLNSKRLEKGDLSQLNNGDFISFYLSKPLSDATKKKDKTTGAAATNPMAGYYFSNLTAPYNVASDHKISEKYTIGAELGRGNFSVVRKGLRKSDGTTVAIKIINKQKLFHNPQTKEATEREVTILKSCHHPNIISYFDIYDSDTYIYIVLELYEGAAGGELFDRIAKYGALPEPEAKSYFKQILEAVEYLHKNGVVHRDLKPENILLASNGVIKITDFGLARIVDEAFRMKTLCGTPQYVAPEVIKLGSTPAHQRGDALGYSKAVDMWSLGVILYILLTGAPPFDERLNREVSLYDQIEQGLYNFPPNLFKNVSTPATELISALLQVEPLNRLSASEALHHPWFTGAKAAATPSFPLPAPASAAAPTFQVPMPVHANSVDNALTDMSITSEGSAMAISPAKNTRRKRKTSVLTTEHLEKENENGDENGDEMVVNSPVKRRKVATRATRGQKANASSPRGQ